MSKIVNLLLTKKIGPEGPIERCLSSSYAKIFALEPDTSLDVMLYLVLPVVAVVVLTFKPAALSSLILAGSC